MLDLGIELVRIQNLVQAVVESIAWRLDYVAARDPQILLPLSLPPRSHRHVILTFKTFPRSHVLERQSDYYHGLLAQVEQGVKAALGPGWDAPFPFPSNEPDKYAPREDYLRSDARWKSFDPFGDSLSVSIEGEPILLSPDHSPKQQLAKDGSAPRRFYGMKNASAVSVRAPEPDTADTRSGEGNEGVEEAIRRISSMPHVALPSLSSGTGTGPLTVENDTAVNLTVYLSGAARTMAVIAPHAVRQITLAPGAYDVAGELSDKSAKPFMERRTFSGGETIRFYVQ